VTLALLGALGGWPGGLIGMKLFRHKTAKWSFKLKYGLALLLAELWAGWHWHHNKPAFNKEQTPHLRVPGIMQIYEQHSEQVWC
jgi:hypothetical protein